MSQFPGYINTLATPYGLANFWVVTEFHFSTTAGTTVTLSGYPTQADSNAPGILAMGTYVFTLSPLQTASFFGGGQSLMAAAVLASSPIWAAATFVPGS